MALIFAVFLTNPSPICVLDEVDAPLDDANVDRFCTLMEKMAADTATRFLVITHHPMTMARMNRLFGVTMGEKGVSQLVSVDLETAQRFTGAAASSAMRRRIFDRCDYDRAVVVAAPHREAAICPPPTADAAAVRTSKLLGAPHGTRLRLSRAISRRQAIVYSIAASISMLRAAAVRRIDLNSVLRLEHHRRIGPLGNARPQVRMIAHPRQTASSRQRLGNLAHLSLRSAMLMPETRPSVGASSSDSASAHCGRQARWSNCRMAEQRDFGAGASAAAPCIP